MSYDINDIQNRLTRRTKPMIGNENTAYVAKNIRDAGISFFGGTPPKDNENNLSDYQQYQLLKDDPERHVLENDVLKAKAKHYSEKSTYPQQKKKMVIGYDENGPVFYDVADDTKILNPNFKQPKPKGTDDFESMLNGTSGQGLHNGAAFPTRNTVPQHVMDAGAIISQMKKNPAELFSNPNSYKVGHIINKNGRNYRVTRLTEDANDPEVEAV